MSGRGAPFLALAIALIAATHARADVNWLNETDLPLECDFANVSYPSSAIVAAGMPVDVYGQVFEAGTTEGAGLVANLVAEVGIGPFGTDPRLDSAWTWQPASFTADVGANDEYVASLAPPPGSWSYAYRFSLDGAGYTAGDLDGAGANAGLAFSVDQLGSLTVVPETRTGAAGALVLAGLAARRARRNQAGRNAIDMRLGTRKSGGPGAPAGGMRDRSTTTPSAGS